jgi:hypothetical protein
MKDSDCELIKQKIEELIEVYGKISAEQAALLTEHHHRLYRLEKCLELIGLDISVGMGVKVPE